MTTKTIISRILPKQIKLKIQTLAKQYLPRWLSKKELNKKIEYNFWIFDNLKKNLEFLNYNFNGKKIVEFGPGDLYGLAYIFLSEGANNVRVVDNYKWMQRMWKYDYVMQYYMEHMERVYNTRLELTSYPTELTPKLQFIIDESGNSGYAVNEADFIYSNASLEHVHQTEQVFKNMFSVLKPGGIMVHQIDLRDHYDFNRPLEYLRFSDEEWESRKHPDDSYTNRLRVDDYRMILSHFPHKILRLVPQYDSKFSAPHNIDLKFANYNDINAVGLLLIIVKL